MSSVILGLVRRPALRGRWRECPLFWLAVATSFDELNTLGEGAVVARTGSYMRKALGGPFQRACPGAVKSTNYANSLLVLVF
jgi:hypothetical protein